MSRAPSGARPAAGVTLRHARPADLPAVIGLLSGAGLPTAGVPVGLDCFIVAESAEGLLGVAGLERYAGAALLRSVAVARPARGSGVGGALVERVLVDAAAHGVTDVYLLTTTAETYFPRHGFSRIARDAVPETVQASVEFQGACPANATVMHRRLTPPASRMTP
jgi:N-acetylglutamate synthase-like GNAT family acetyltransferase